MGSKPSNNFQSDRPESGGADRNMEREKSGLLEREKERFAVDEQARRASRPEDKGHRAPPSSEAPDVDPETR